MRMAMLEADAERLTAMTNVTSDRQAYAAKGGLSATLGLRAMIRRNETMIQRNLPAGIKGGLPALREGDQARGAVVQEAQVDGATFPTVGQIYRDQLKLQIPGEPIACRWGRMGGRICLEAISAGASMAR